jgi:hypothetical protein
MTKRNKGKIETKALRQSAEIQLKGNKAENKPALNAE